MGVLAVILFFVFCYGLGTACTFFWKEKGYEKHLMRIGIGLAAWVVLLILLDFFNLPLDWKLVLAVSLLCWAWVLYRNRKELSFKIPIPNILTIVALVLFGLTLFMYAKGAFAYPWLEDDDPWAHATGIKYVSLERNFNDLHNQFGYINPYPPGYDGIFGVLHQVSPHLVWTMKFFNALISSLGILFFAFFAKRFLKSTPKALAATTIFAMIPSYLSHFIWAHSLSITLFIVSLYCLVRIAESKQWILPTIILIGGIAFTQPSKLLKYSAMFFIFLVFISLSRKKLAWPEIGAVAGGYALSLLWWGTRAVTLLSGVGNPASKVGATSGLWGTIQRLFPPGSGTGTRAYTFSDFFIAKGQNMINNPLGWGIAISLLLVIAIIVILMNYKNYPGEEKSRTQILLFWLLFTFLGVNSLTFNLPVGFHAFRFWMLLAIPVSLLAAEGFLFVSDFLVKQKIPMAASILLLVALLFFTAGLQKYQVNISQWPPGAFWTSGEELQGYLSLLSLPPDTRVFTYQNPEPVIGLNAFDCMWCDDVFEFRKGALLANATELHAWLKEHDYEYLIISGMAVRELQEKYGNQTLEMVNRRVTDLATSQLFFPAFQNQAVVLFKVA